MSIYRRQGKSPDILYKELNERLRLIHERYQNPKILIGGDFNDQTPPKKFEISPSGVSPYNMNKFSHPLSCVIRV